MEIYQAIFAAVGILLPAWIARRVIGRRLGWAGRLLGGLLASVGVAVATITLQPPVGHYAILVLGFAFGFWFTYRASDRRALAADLVATLAGFGVLFSLLTTSLIAVSVFLLAAAIATLAGRYFTTASRAGLMEVPRPLPGSEQ